MRLLETRPPNPGEAELRLTKDSYGKNIPTYAILSHTWGEEEVLYSDVQSGDYALNQGYRKVQLARHHAHNEGFEYIWIDTCCIDKSSSAELSEAINSMFKWYELAQKCYVYLADVTWVDNEVQRLHAFSESRWWSRGWTLQELIAPQHVNFFSEDWKNIGEKAALSKIITTITKIDLEYLVRSRPLSEASIAKRMSWAAFRETTREEDIAYCLLGIFDVNMPMLYGEGSKAFTRLQEAILRNSDDHSLFAWVTNNLSPSASHTKRDLKATIRAYRRRHGSRQLPDKPQDFCSLSAESSSGESSNEVGPEHGLRHEILAQTSGEQRKDWSSRWGSRTEQTPGRAMSSTNQNQDEDFGRLLDDSWHRLEEVDKNVWRQISPTLTDFHGLLADSPKDFALTFHVVPRGDRRKRRPYAMTNRGLEIDLRLQCVKFSNHEDIFAAALECPGLDSRSTSNRCLSILLQRIPGSADQYTRIATGHIARIDPENLRPQTTFIRQYKPLSVQSHWLGLNMVLDYTKSSSPLRLTHTVYDKSLPDVPDPYMLIWLAPENVDKNVRCVFPVKRSIESGPLVVSAVLIFSAKNLTRPPTPRHQIHVAVMVAVDHTGNLVWDLCEVSGSPEFHHFEAIDFKPHNLEAWIDFGPCKFHLSAFKEKIRDNHGTRQFHVIVLDASEEYLWSPRKENFTRLRIEKGQMHTHTIWGTVHEELVPRADRSMHD